jgi:hypothetical protein
MLSLGSIITIEMNKMRDVSPFTAITLARPTHKNIKNLKLVNIYLTPSFTRRCLSTDFFKI